MDETFSHKFKKHFIPPYEQRKIKAIVWYYAPLCDKPVSLKQLQGKIGSELDLWFTYNELFQHLHSWQEATQSFESKRFLKGNQNEKANKRRKGQTSNF